MLKLFNLAFVVPCSVLQLILPGTFLSILITRHHDVSQTPFAQTGP